MNFKKILFLLLVIATAFAFVACGGDEENNTPTDTPTPDVDNTTYYTVTFDYAGVLAQKIAENAKATAPEAPAKDGYTFCGWLLNGVAYDFETPVTGNITLTPSWEATEYTITFVDGSTVLSDLTKTYTIESQDIVLQSISKEHYNFMGWYKDANFTESIQKVKTGSFGNLTLYVQFTVKNYGITYSLDGGTNNDSNPQSYNINSEFPILLSDPNREGYDFVGWFTDADCTVAFESIAELSGNVTVYAKWEESEIVIPPDPGPGDDPVVDEREYTIKYFDGTTELDLDPDKYTSGHALTIPGITKAHYTFEGWYTTATFDEGTEAVITETTTGDLVLYAKFVPVSYNITYNLEGGINDGSNPDTYTVEDKDFEFLSPTKEGHVFAGWFLDADYKVQVSTLRGKSGDIQLYAKWVQKGSSGILTPEDEF